MKRKILILTIILILILPIVLAQEEMNLQFNIKEDGGVSVSGASTINPNIPEITYKNNIVSGETQFLTSKNGTTWNFAINIKNITYHYVKILLPKNAKLEVKSIIANSQPIITTNNNNVVLEIEDYDEFIISFDYQLGKKKTDFSWVWILIIIVLLIILATLIFLIRKKSKKQAFSEIAKEIKIKQGKIKTRKKDKYQAIKERLRTVRNTLNERENRIIDMLLKENLKSTQGKLQKISGIPKASFSRHILALEQKNLIIKHGKGKLNIIELNKDFDKAK